MLNKFTQINFLKRFPKQCCCQYLFVDPGNFTGLTFIELSEENIFKSTDIFTLRQEGTVVNMWKYFDSIFRIIKPSKVIFEDVDFRANSLKSVTAAKRGDLFTLAKMIGGYMSITAQHNIEFDMIYSREWKGNMKDDAVKARIKFLTGEEITNSHIADSFGMALSFMGIFA